MNWFWDIMRAVSNSSMIDNFMWQGCFSFHYYLATLSTNWVQIFHRIVILCICMLRYTKGRRLVFDNYQSCQVSLSSSMKVGSEQRFGEPRIFNQPEKKNYDLAPSVAFWKRPYQKLHKSHQNGYAYGYRNSVTL